MKIEKLKFYAAEITSQSDPLNNVFDVTVRFKGSSFVGYYHVIAKYRFGIPAIQEKVESVNLMARMLDETHKIFIAQSAEEVDKEIVKRLGETENSAYSVFLPYIAGGCDIFESPGEMRFKALHTAIHVCQAINAYSLGIATGAIIHQ